MAIFNINDVDYLGRVNEHDLTEGTAKKRRTIKEKLFWHIKKHDISTENLCRVELVTMPRFCGYAFNPVSIYYCYDINDELKVLVLEVNNTFGEKHLYILDRDNEADKSIRLGFDMSFTIKRAFHVSPFNDRKGIYKAFCKDPKSGYLDMRLVMYTDPSHSDDVPSENITHKSNTPIQQFRKKMVATASGHSYSLNLISVIYAIMTYPLEIFLTMPRILKEAYKLHYYKDLGIYHRPIPVEGTVVKLDPNFIDRHTSIINITIHLPDPNIPPIQIHSDNYNGDLQNIKHIKISLHNYSFFTNILINQNFYRALLIGYFEKAWDCDDLPSLIDLFFNHSNIIEDDLKDKHDNSIHRDNKQRLSFYESKIAMIRRWFWKKLLTDENAGGIKSKQEFDEMLHSLWPAEGVDQDFITSIAQNDVCFDLRLKAIINSHKNVAIALRDLLIKNNENKILALFGYTHLYLLTIPSNNSIKHLQPLISHQLHLLPFPPRYIPYEGKEPIVHLIDRFVFLDNYSIFKKRWEKIKYLLMVGLMACAYKADFKFWKLTTRFIDGPSGNPFLGERWLWEGVINLLKGGKDYEKEIYRIDDEEKKENNNFLEGWEVVYERKANSNKLELMTPPSPLLILPRKDEILKEDKQFRLWYFMKCYRNRITNMLSNYHCVVFFILIAVLMVKAFPKQNLRVRNPCFPPIDTCVSSCAAPKLIQDSSGASSNNYESCFSNNHALESCDELEQQVAYCNQNENNYNLVCKRTPLNNLPIHYKQPLFMVRSLLNKRSPIILDIGSEGYNQYQQENLCDSDLAECCSQQQQQSICNENENSFSKVGKRNLNKRIMNIGYQGQKRRLNGRSYLSNCNGLYKRDGNYPRFTR
ncbi:3922_t:CDS:2 [Dentiscutata heterogama]|uniref:3922_t:CDS:1 n=1 Tax=Dentiscutata heterogama TaxID=1316150 RepID=A0ACA9K6D0_9GLOM|nr:3922_t:CDS:2 [Dentiscutata heterogama]